MKEQHPETTFSALAKVGFLTAAIALATTGTGCAYLHEQFGQYDKAVIEILETKGKDAAFAQIDKWGADGKLGYANADKLKTAIPLGIEKIKDAMKNEK